MNRLVTWIVWICIMCTLTVPVFAAENDSVAVIYGADVAYTVYIPEAVYIDADGKHYTEIKISNAILPSNTKLTVVLTGTSYANGTWHLQNADNKTIAYHIAVEGQDGKFTRVANNAEILSCQAGEASHNDAVRFLCFDLAQQAQTGTFYDMLTFVITYIA